MKIKTLTIAAALLMSGTAAYAQSADMSNSASNSNPQTNATSTDSMETTGATTSGSRHKHHQTVTGANTNDGMADKQHAGSPSDSPRSGTQSGMSNQTMNPAVNADKPTQ